MNAWSFPAAAALYVVLTVFVYFSYPETWRKHRLFRAAAAFWHVLGLASAALVFTAFRVISSDGLRAVIVRVGSCYYITTTIQALLLCLRLVSSRAFRFLGGTAPEQRRCFDKRVQVAGIIALSFVIFFLGYFGIGNVHDTRREVSVNAPSAEQALDICLIADIHAGAATWERTYNDMTALIDASGADVLLIAGDAFDETTRPADVERLARVLREIEPPRYGIYFVYGNHDSKTEDWAAQQLRAMGVTVLDDQMVLLGEDIQLIGATDPRHGAKSPDALFADCAPDPDRPILVLTHRPQGFRLLSEQGADLVMAGHSHGFNIPQFLGSPLLGDMYAGQKDFDGMTAITTSGISAWGFHYKWPAVSEVVTIHVTFGAA